MITDISSQDKYYKALVDRNSDYIGIFYAGVVTTSVFCISTCRARKPKRENVLFFNNFKEALDNGFRPCKICNPTANAYSAPEDIQQCIDMVKNNPKEKIKDYQLKELGIEPSYVRRWFKKHYGITFHAYQRMYRINNAYNELKAGKKTTDTAFDNQFESLSGFAYTYKKILGKAPKQSLHDNILLLSRITTPLGPMFICSSDKGICMLEFVDRRMLETEFKDLQMKLNARIITGENKHIQHAKKQLKEYFDGSRTSFELQLDMPGTEFQQKVWKILQEIPFGETRSYQEQANNMENPKAVRAVASANGNNRISIIVPCHRVIGKDGKLTGYGGGLERKRWLLLHERNVKGDKANLFSNV